MLHQIINTCAESKFLPSRLCDPCLLDTKSEASIISWRFASGGDCAERCVDCIGGVLTAARRIVATTLMFLAAVQNVVVTT